MASLISPPAAFSSSPIHSDSGLHGSLCFRSPFFKKSHTLSLSHSCSAPYSLSRPPDSIICCCRNNFSESPSPASNSGDSSWVQQFITSAALTLENFLNSRLKSSKSDIHVKEGKSEDKEVDVDDWDWERWQRYFSEIENQERLVSILKSQLTHAIEKEDYEDAARMKVAIAAAATTDIVGTVMSILKKAVDEERYKDAIFVRDNAGAGLVGWWAGVSNDENDPFGCIIRINAEHGRYVARRYTPRHLATLTTGVPLFEIFVTLTEKGEYRHQAVYLKRKAASETDPSFFPMPSAASSSMNKMNPAAGKTDVFAPAVEEDAEDEEDKDDPDLTDGFSGFQNLLQDMIPGVRLKVLKVMGAGKVDRDLISKVVEQIIEEEDDEKDIEAELDDTDAEDENSSGSEEEKDDEEMVAGNGNIDMEEENELAVKLVVSPRLIQSLSGIAPPRDLVRVPAKLEPKGCKSFTFCIPDDEELQDSISKDIPKRKAKTQGQRTIEHVMYDLVKFISRGEKIPAKVLKDFGDIISISLSQAQNHQPLSGCTSFSRIDLPVYPDPLNGIYVGSHGPHTSEVIQMKRKFGQWQEDAGTEGPSDLHFYEYVEAVKLTGDPYVPAGKVAFRAKIGKRYQLPHKGIIPEEFGVVARYKGQGRLAEPGFQNPRWIDGELVILDGKYIKGGPVIGFVYWTRDHHQFLMFFNRLRIQE